MCWHLPSLVFLAIKCGVAGLDKHVRKFFHLKLHVEAARISTSWRRYEIDRLTSAYLETSREGFVLDEWLEALLLKCGRHWAWR